jgi:hypothetical protein
MFEKVVGHYCAGGALRRCLRSGPAVICLLSISLITAAKAETRQWYRWITDNTNTPASLNFCVPSAISPEEEYKKWRSYYQYYEPYIKVTIIDSKSNPSIPGDEVNVCFQGPASELQGVDCEEFFRSWASCHAVTRAPARPFP